MRAEAKELYNHTKNRFEEELKNISPSCISPIICVRQVIKRAIDLYITDYCTTGTKREDVFSDEDFKEVSNKIYNEIMKSGL